MPFIGKQSTSNSQITNYTTTVGSGGQTNFTVVIEGGDETHVYLNGVLLKETTDYTVSSTQVSLASPAVENDIVEIKVFRSFALADAVRASDGGTFSGDVTVPNLTLSSNVIKASDGGSTITLDDSDNVTIAGNLKVKDGGTIGSSSDADAITISSSGAVTLSSDFVPATPLSHRNVVINGAMQVAQRGDIATGKTTSGVYAVDRMAMGMENMGAYTLSQETLTSGGAYNAGFQKAFRIDCTTADASPSADDNLFFQYKLEGQDLGVFRKGTSEARQFTLQFWVKSNKTGTGQVCLFDDNSRAVGKTYPISSANTWEHITLTFPADTSGAFDDDNTKGLEIEWALDAGSTFKGGTLPATWGASNNNFRSINDFALADNTANDWAITGIQLEAGSVATPFEHRSYADELQRCQRYCHKWEAGHTYGSLLHSGYGAGSNQTNRRVVYSLPVRMRTASQTLTPNGNFRVLLGGSIGGVSLVLSRGGYNVVLLQFNHNSNSASGVLEIGADNDADANFILETEL